MRPHSATHADTPHMPTLAPLHSTVRPRSRLLCSLGLLFGWIFVTLAPAAQVIIPGPANSGEFGASVATLPNGNIVVTDPGFDLDDQVNVGAVYLLEPDGTRISMLHGSRSFDRVGDVVEVLHNGNFVVRSPGWNGIGAVTFGTATHGVSGVVSASNSLVGTGGTIIRLSNGNYLVLNPDWRQTPSERLGAVTFGSGLTGVSGVVSAANSLIGSTSSNAFPGQVVELRSGDYVVLSSGLNQAGAATFGSGTSGVSGVISVANSLVGSRAGDFEYAQVVPLDGDRYVVLTKHWGTSTAVRLGAVTFSLDSGGVRGLISAERSLIGAQAYDDVGSELTELANGNLVIHSNWNANNAPLRGALTFASRSVGVRGVVTAANSLVGVGSARVHPLPDGRYVISSPWWDNGRGAVTIASGSAGLSGTIDPAVSLIGVGSDDQIGAGVTVLTNGNFVVSSPNWKRGTEPAVGAVTYVSAAAGLPRVISPANSLVGNGSYDYVGSQTVALRNGHYVVGSPRWSNGDAYDAGAATWASGVQGITGEIGPQNSLVGTRSRDEVGRQIVPLRNGNYVVLSNNWANGTVDRAGAVTLGSSSGGLIGPVSPANSLVGSFDDRVGTEVVELENSNFLVISRQWDNGGIVDAGAVTFVSGTTGISGMVSAANSLVGSVPSDLRWGHGVLLLRNSNYVVSSSYRAGNVWYQFATFGSGLTGVSGSIGPALSLTRGGALTALDNGHYVVEGAEWFNGSIGELGSVTLGLSDGSVYGPADSTHSVLGVASGQGHPMRWGYDAARNQLVVGQRTSNRIVLHSSGLATTTTLAAESSIIDMPVTFTATVAATPNAPIDGQVRVQASTGQSCVGSTPTPVSATAVSFACSLRFDTAGTATVIAEYTGSIRHAWSRSSAIPHTTQTLVIHRDGFEAP